MDCRISREQLWSWIDRDAPELEAHLDGCPECRERAGEIRRKISAVAAGASRVVPLPGRIGAYRIRSLLGEGGQAWVYEAEQNSPRRTVALKVLKGTGLENRKLLKHFHRESQALAQLTHPAIATIYESGTTDEGLYYFAMERIEGRSLDRHVADNGLRLREILEIFQTICQGVDHAHRKGIIHRDLKPSNILVDETGAPRILDFGLARISHDDSPSDMTITHTGHVEGTPRYMSPEQAAGRNTDVDCRADVYSLGVVLYELLTGQAPFEAGPAKLDPAARDRQQITPPSRHRPELRGEMDSVLLRALAGEPERRYSSAADLAEDLRRFLSNEPILARPPGRRYRLRKHLRRQRLRYVSGFLLAALGLAILLIAGRDRYDVDLVRRQTLELRRDLFIHGPTAALRDRALAFSRNYEDLPEVTFVYAQSLVLDRATHIAINILQTAYSKDPGNRAFQVLLDELQDTPRSEDDLAPTSAHEGYMLSLATLELELSQARAVSAALIDGTYIPALAAAAFMSEAANDLQSALQWATKLSEQERGSYDWLIYNVELLYRTGRFEEALVECNAALAEFPGNRNLHHTRSRVYRRLKRYAEAVDDQEMTILAGGADVPASAWPRFHRGTLLWMLGRDEEAASEYYKADEMLMQPTYANARLYLVLHGLNRPDEAQRVLDEAVAELQGDPWLAQIYACLAGELPPAELVSKADNPAQSCEAFYYAAETHLLAGEKAIAIAYFTDCLRSGQETDPDEFWEPMSEFELAGWRLEHLGDTGDLYRQ